MKYILIILLISISFAGYSQTATNNPSVYRWINGSIPANGATPPLSIGGNHWYQTNDKLAFYNSGLSIWQNILTESLASTTYIPLAGTSTWTGFKKAGNIFGIGSGSGAGYLNANTTAQLDVAQGNITAILGADNAIQTRTDNTTKVAVVGSAPYSIGSIPTGIFSTDNNSLGSLLKIGGGTSRVNAVTKIGFFLAPNINTPLGTEVAYVTTSGIQYTTDISSGFTVNHLINKGYADVQYIFTSSNGITKTGNNFTLGGNIQSATQIGLQNNNFTLINVGSSGGTLGLTSSSLNIGLTSAGLQNKGIVFNNTSMVVTDNNTKGFEYAADYSANFTNESLITKRYADTKQTSLTLTTTGTSGPATLIGSTLNIPNYASGGGSGTVTSFSKTDGYGISSSVANSTTTPNHTIAVDTTVIVRKPYLATLNGSVVHLAGTETIAGIKTFSAKTNHNAGWGTTNSSNTVDNGTIYWKSGTYGINIGLSGSPSGSNKTQNLQDDNGDIALTKNFAQFAYLAKTANYTVLSSDWGLSPMLTVTVDATAGNVTITLPTASTVAGKMLNIKRIDASANTVTISSAQNIDGGATLGVAMQWGNAQIQSISTQYITL